MIAIQGLLLWCFHDYTLIRICTRNTFIFKQSNENGWKYPFSLFSFQTKSFGCAGFKILQFDYLNHLVGSNILTMKSFYKFYLFMF